MNHRHLIPLALLCALCITGCKRKPARTAEDNSPVSPGSPTSSEPWPSAGATAADRQEWLERTFVKAYEEVGTHDPRWDATARKALELYSHLLVQYDSNQASELATRLQQIRAENCTDPLVLYVNLRTTDSDTEDASAATAEAYRRVADGMMSSGYPAIRKFYAAVRAADAWHGAHGGQSDAMPMLGRFRRGAFAQLEIVLHDPETPFMEAYLAADALQQVISANTKEKDDLLPPLIDYFQTRWLQEGLAWNFCGHAYVQLAWNRRGSGYANQVTEAGWSGFATNLTEAGRCLERSWQLDPKNSDTAATMMTVVLGQGQGRDRMELWFHRAMEVDAACYEAARTKVWYLQPKWYGSAEEAIAFGRECVASKVWKGRVPLVLWQAHMMLANDKASGLKDAYWKQPGVWPDVRDSFERYFELNPDGRGWRHDYALYAYKCGQYDKFLDQLPQMGWVNYPFFGGPQAFASMVAEAEQQTGRKARLP